ncbi:ferredoxin-NADP reductase [Bradyrhizobium liaoningense]
MKALDETLGLDRLEFALVLDAGQGLRRRLVVGRLEDAAEQDRHIFELDADPLLDRRNRQMAEIGVGAAEVEQELRGGTGQNHSP